MYLYFSILRNQSGVSLSDLDSPGVNLSPKAMLYQQRPHTGEAEFVGVALPVDINMIFEVGVMIFCIMFCVKVVSLSLFWPQRSAM